MKSNEGATQVLLAHCASCSVSLWQLTQWASDTQLANYTQSHESTV